MNSQSVILLSIYLGLCLSLVGCVFGYSHFRNSAHRKEKFMTKRVYITLEHPGSDWGAEIVYFIIPVDIPERRVATEVRCAMNGLDAGCYHCSQDFADAALDIAARKLNGDWGYILSSGVVYVEYEQ